MTTAMTTSHFELVPSDLTSAPTETRHRALRAVPQDAAPRPDAVVHDLDATRSDQREDRLVAGQRRRLDTRARTLGQLLERRPELRGAHAPADLALEGLYAGI